MTNAITSDQKRVDAPSDNGHLSTPMGVSEATAVADGEASKQSSSADESNKPYLPKKSLAFWAIICALCAAGLLTSLEATITSTALPTIIEALGGADLYIWVVNIFFLTM